MLADRGGMSRANPAMRMSKPPCGATSTMGAAGSQAVVSSIAVENPASTPKMPTGEPDDRDDREDHRDDGAVCEAVPAGHLLGSGTRRARCSTRRPRRRADAARDQSGNHGGRRRGTSAATLNLIVATASPMGDREPTGTGRRASRRRAR